MSAIPSDRSRHTTGEEDLNLEHTAFFCPPVMIRCSSCDACRNDQISSDLAVHLCIVKRWHEGFQNKWLLTFNRSKPSVLFNIDGDGVLGLHFSSYAEESNEAIQFL